MANKNTLVDQIRSEVSNLLGSCERLRALSTELKMRKMEFIEEEDFKGTVNQDLVNGDMANAATAIDKLNEALMQDGIGQALYVLKR